MIKKTAFMGMVLATAMTLTACSPEPEYIHVGPNWAAINELESSQKSFELRISTNKSEYKVGDELEINVRSKEAGRVWLVQVDPNDNVTLMLPNQVYPNNRINENETFYFPPKGVNWSATASEPYGSSVMAVIVTTGDADLNAVFANQAGDKDLMNKAFVIAQKDPQWAVAKKVIKVVKDEAK